MKRNEPDEKVIVRVDDSEEKFDSLHKNITQLVSETRASLKSDFAESFTVLETNLSALHQFGCQMVSETEEIREHLASVLTLVDSKVSLEQFYRS